MVLTGLSCAGEPESWLPAGDSSFESAGVSGSAPSRDDDFDGAPDDSEGNGEERPVIEADVYRFVGDRLYVLNATRGLFVFDVEDAGDPVEIGRAPMSGIPVEMYVRGERAYAVLRDEAWWGWGWGWRGGAGEDDVAAGDVVQAPTWGSRIVGVDLSDPAAPLPLGEVELDGMVAATRMVGHVLYAVANRWDAELGERMTVTSIDVAENATLQEVEQLELEGAGLYVQATSDAFVIAGQRWGGEQGAETEVTWVDISSPAGRMLRRGQVALSGYLREDTGLDVRSGQLRVLTREWMTNETKLRILDATDPDRLPQLGELSYFYDGSLFGTAFDEDRLYMVHYMRIDPLEVVDLSDPTHPTITGILEMPGWVERIAPLGDRLIGLGIDDSLGTRRVSVSLFDVADPAEPALLDRLTTGPDWGWSVASWERRAWTVLPDEGLVLFPYSGWSEAEQRELHALGILEMSPAQLTARGEVIAPAPVERGALYEQHVYALSQQALQVVDLRDRDHPVATATVELARTVLDYARTAHVGVELIQPGLGYWGYWGGQVGSELRLTPLGAPDGSEELGRVALPQAAQAVLVDGESAAAIRTWDGCAGWSDLERPCAAGLRPGVAVVDLSVPSRPHVVADLELPRTPPIPEGLADQAWRWSSWQVRYAAPWGGWEAGSPALAMGEGLFGLLRTTTTSCWSRAACEALGIVPQEPVEVPVEPGEPEEPDDRAGDGDAAWVYGTRTDMALAVLDLTEPSAPLIQGPYELGEGVLEGAFTVGETLVGSRARVSRLDEQGRTLVRYWLERYDLDREFGVRPMPSINVPGVVIALRDEVATTVDVQWTDDAGWGYEMWLGTVRLGDDAAVRIGALRLGTEIGSVAADGPWVFAVRGLVPADVAPGEDGWTMTSALAVIDTADGAVTLTDELDLGESWWSLAAVTPRALVLSGGSASVTILRRAEPKAPEIISSVRVPGYATRMVVDDETLYRCAGPYGIQAIPLE